MTQPTILDAMAHPAVWGPWFRDPTTWAPWRTFLAALFGLPMTTADLDLYRTCTGRDQPPPGGCTEAWLVVGRRGGKSMTLAVIASYLAVFHQPPRPFDRGYFYRHTINQPHLDYPWESRARPLTRFVTPNRR